MLVNIFLHTYLVTMRLLSSAVLVQALYYATL